MTDPKARKLTDQQKVDAVERVTAVHNLANRTHSSTYAHFLELVNATRPDPAAVEEARFKAVAAFEACLDTAIGMRGVFVSMYIRND